MADIKKLANKVRSKLKSEYNSSILSSAGAATNDHFNCLTVTDRLFLFSLSIQTLINACDTAKAKCFNSFLF